MQRRKREKESHADRIYLSGSTHSAKARITGAITVDQSFGGFSCRVHGFVIECLDGARLTPKWAARPGKYTVAKVMSRSPRYHELSP